MPTYMGKTVTDEQIKTLCEAYREGQKSMNFPVEDGDQVILDACTKAGVMSPYAPSAYALGAGAKVATPK